MYTGYDAIRSAPVVVKSLITGEEGSRAARALEFRVAIHSLITGPRSLPLLRGMPTNSWTPHVSALEFD